MFHETSSFEHNTEPHPRPEMKPQEEVQLICQYWHNNILFILDSHAN